MSSVGKTSMAMNDEVGMEVAIKIMLVAFKH